MIETIGNTHVSHVLRTISEGHKVLIVVLYGGMGGIISAGMLHAMEQFGISPRHNKNISVIGVSAGAANVLGFCAGRLDESPGIYNELGTRVKERAWYDPSRMSDVLEVGYLTELLREKLGTGFLDECRGDAFVSTTRVRDVKGILHNLKKAECPFEVTHASMRMPVLLQGTVSIGGEQFVDGACSASLVDMVRLVKPKQILIVGSRPLYGKLPPGEIPLSEFMLRQIARAYPPAVREQSVQTDKSLNTGLSRVKGAKYIKSFGIFPWRGVAWDQTDPSVLTKAFYRAYDDTTRLLRSAA